MENLDLRKINRKDAAKKVKRFVSLNQDKRKLRIALSRNKSVSDVVHKVLNKLDLKYNSRTF